MNTPPEESQFLQGTWSQKMQIIKAVSLFPAMSLMLFIRRRLGFRALNPIMIAMLFAVIFAIGVLFPSRPGTQGCIPMVIYAFVILGLSRWLRYKRWVELCGGVRWHTYSIVQAFPGLNPCRCRPSCWSTGACRASLTRWSAC